MNEMGHERCCAPSNSPSEADAGFVIVKEKADAFPQRKEHCAVETTSKGKPLQRTSGGECTEFRVFSHINRRWLRHHWVFQSALCGGVHYHAVRHPSSRTCNPIPQQEHQERGSLSGDTCHQNRGRVQK